MKNVEWKDRCVGIYIKKKGIIPRVEIKVLDFIANCTSITITIC